MKKIRRTNKIVNEKTLLVTVDIGKYKNYGYARFGDGRELQPFAFGNHYMGFRRFWRIIQDLKEKEQLSNVVVGFESTGSYGVPFQHFLKDKPVRMVLVNAFHTKRVKELADNSPRKTDKKDPRVMADIIELGHWLHVVIAEGVAARLRVLSHARDDYMKGRTALYNQVQNLMFEIFPEFEQVMKDLKLKTSRYLLEHHPTPESIIALGLEPLVEVMHRISRGKIKKARARALYEAAKHSIGIKEGQEEIVLHITHYLMLIADYERMIKKVETEISRLLKEVPISRYLLSIKGVGETTVAGIIGEVADFERFPSYAELEKFAGLNLYEVSSGKHRGRKRISKRGRPLMRKLLYFASINVVKKGGIYHNRYQRYLKRGMPKVKALTAISRQLLRLIFAVVRDHREFDRSYFEKNSHSYKAVA